MNKIKWSILLDLEGYWIDKIKTTYIGDDGALIDKKVYAMDAFWEGTHFKKEYECRANCI